MNLPEITQHDLQMLNKILERLSPNDPLQRHALLVAIAFVHHFIEPIDLQDLPTAPAAHFLTTLQSTLARFASLTISTRAPRKQKAEQPSSSQHGGTPTRQSPPTAIQFLHATWNLN